MMTDEKKQPSRARQPFAIRLPPEVHAALEEEAADQTEEMRKVTKDPQAKVGPHEVARRVMENWARRRPKKA